MFQNYLDKAKSFISANKTILIKGAAVIGGAILGAVVVTIITSQSDESIPEEWEIEGAAAEDDEDSENDEE